ncbi:MAG: lipopolysaccharide transport periplasmic protein LptA [Deltaproteobacteria bacterium]|nr:lipopolysaccharide transport periplasmic protein LptA [Deltaproteobacteria bacterium]
MKKYYFFLFWVLTLLIILIPYTAPIAEGLSDSNKPIHIVSDRLDVHSDNRVAIFSGNVVVTQEDTVINSDKFCLHYKNRGNKTRENYPAINPGVASVGDLEKIEAEGNVIIRQKGKVVTGAYAVFYNEEQKVVVTGNPVMKEGDNVIEGDKVIFFLKENKGIVESSSSKRVTATIYPEEKKQVK